MKKKYTERKFKKEYFAVRSELEMLINNSVSTENYLLPYGSKKLMNVFKIAIETMDKFYHSYEMKLYQLVVLIKHLHKDCNSNEFDADFRGELFNISSRIMGNSNKYEEWKKYSLLIDDMYPHGVYLQ